MNWDDLRFFLAVHRAQTLTAAARDLGVDQTTVGRRLSALEKGLEARLFDRSPEGLTLSHVGESILEDAMRAEQAMLDVVRTAQGEDARTEGMVRLATSEALFVAFLRPLLASFHQRFPRIFLELSTGTGNVDLLRRQADLAFRPGHQAPVHKELIARRLAQLTLGLFASPAYLEERPFHGSLEGHDFVAFDPEFEREGTEWVVEGRPGARSVFVTNSMLAVAEAVSSGWGLGLFPVFLGRGREIVRLDFESESPSLWLLVHPDVRRSARVRALIDDLTAQIEAERGVLEGD